MSCGADGAIPTTASAPTCDQGDRAGAWREEMIDSQAHECVRSTGWREPPDRWGEAEQEAVDDEAPGEQRDDCADLVVDDRSEAGADCAPQGRADEPAEREQ
jgi:Zn ribbon nucleic-acid-binding protein